MGQCAKSAVGRGVAVAADDGHAWQGETLFRTNDVNDALTVVEFVVVFDVEVGSVLCQGLDLECGFRVVDAVAAVRGRHVVVDDGQGLARLAELTARHTQTFESLRAGYLMDQMAIDVE